MSVEQDLHTPVARLTQDEAVLVRRVVRDALASQALSEPAREVAQRLRDKLRALGPSALVEYVVSEPAYVGSIPPRVDQPVHPPVHPTHNIALAYGDIVCLCTVCDAKSCQLEAPTPLMLSPCPGRPYSREQLREDAGGFDLARKVMGRAIAKIQSKH